MGLRIVVVDDNPHVRWEGRVYPVNATFHRFLAAFLDLPDAPVSSIVHCIPLRDAVAPPTTLAIDERIEVIGTAPFDGISGFLRHAGPIARLNAPVLRRAIDGADLVWLKVPASNAPLAGWLAWRAGVPRFGYVAGSAFAVARGRGLGLAAQAVGLAYDVAGRLAGGRHRVVVGRDIVGGRGIVTSLVEPEEIRDRSGEPWPPIPWRLRLGWAGRLVPGKGLEVLIDALALLVAEERAGDRVELVVIGDGPLRADLEARAVARGVGERIHWLGYIADRPTYLEALASCDIFVFPSPAEGFPKVVLDAMAVGVPVVATPSGSLGDLVGASLIATIATSPPGAGATAVVRTLRDLPATPDRGVSLRTAGTTFAADHTRRAEADRLVKVWRSALVRDRQMANPVQ